MVSPLASLVRPVQVHLVSQRPSIFKSYLCISLHTCALFPVSYRVLMFQVPTLVVVLVVRRVVGALASRRLSPARFMSSTREDSSSTKPLAENAFVVSVINSFLREWAVDPLHNPQPGGPAPNLEGQAFFCWGFPPPHATGSTSLAWLTGSR